MMQLPLDESLCFALQNPNPNWNSLSEIPNDHIMAFLACALHYDLHIPSVIRFLRGNYVGFHRNIPKLLPTLKKIIPLHLMDEWISTMTAGAPTHLSAEVSLENAQRYRQYGNHPSITLKPEK